jgi:hypothetical protein
MRRGVTAGAFVDEDPAFLAKAFSALDQVPLADWADGMKLPRRGGRAHAAVGGAIDSGSEGHRGRRWTYRAWLTG